MAPKAEKKPAEKKPAEKKKTTVVEKAPTEKKLKPGKQPTAEIFYHRLQARARQWIRDRRATTHAQVMDRVRSPASLYLLDQTILLEKRRKGLSNMCSGFFAEKSGATRGKILDMVKNEDSGSPGWSASVAVPATAAAAAAAATMATTAAATAKNSISSKVPPCLIVYFPGNALRNAGKLWDP